MMADVEPEANIDLAKSWWPDQRNVWTPIGWPSHLFRFHVVYNGDLLVTPGGWLDKAHTRKYKQYNFQLNFVPSADGSLPPLPSDARKLYKMDGGIGVQGWRGDKRTPVLWTEWPMQDGVVMRKEIFAHMKGGAEVKAGDEPLFAWIRLSVSHVDPRRAPDTFSFSVQLSQAYYDVGGSIEDSVFLHVKPEKAKLPQPLTAKVIPGENPGLQIEQEGKVRVYAFPESVGQLSFTDGPSGSGVYQLRVELPVRQGASVDMLVPILPMAEEEVLAEAEFGFDRALAEAESFWREKPSTAARIRTPEQYINDAIERNIQFARIIAERNPENGEFSFLSGSYGYDVLWSTPTSMISHMFLDLLGRHDTVRKHVQLYKANQGSVKPPGSDYTQHPGYFSTPKTLTSIDWLSDHGAILELLSRHALLTGDEAFIDEWLDPIVDGLDFIKDSCAVTDHAGVEGLMPPAIATDNGVPSQAIWIQAWTYKGLTTSVRLLKRLEHPRAAEFEAFAADFKETFQEAFFAQTEKESSWTDPDGEEHPILPANLIPPPTHHVYDDAFHLDTGPLCLPWAGLLQADHPLMDSFADFFRVGPNTKLRAPWTGAITRAVLEREISSCEPCYSWNIVNSWKTGDRQRFLEGMYSLFTGAISKQTFINFEHRNAMSGNVFVAPLMTWCLRQAVLDDQFEPGRLHLLRLVPLAWISVEEESVFENMPSEFGPVDLRFKRSTDGEALEVAFSGDWRRQPERILLHTPPLFGLSKVVVNGVEHSASGTIEVAPE